MHMYKYKGIKYLPIYNLFLHYLPDIVYIYVALVCVSVLCLCCKQTYQQKKIAERYFGSEKKRQI